jgi:hypothetical protein
MTTRWARLARGWMVAGFSTFVAALSHMLGGGHAPGWLGLILSLAFAGVVCVGLAGRAVSGARVGVSVVLSQLIFHGLFSVGAPGGALVSAPVAGLHGHQATSVLPAAAETSSFAAGHGTSMWVFHAAAAVVTIVALRYGEAVSRRLLNLARLAVRAMAKPVIDHVVVPLRLAQRAASNVLVRGDAAALSSSLRRRGPPRLVTRVI